MKEKPLPNRICVDFDSTLCRSKFNEATGKYDMGEAYEPVAEAVTNQFFHGAEIVIWTARPKKEWADVKRWLNAETIPFSKIKKKPLAKIYVDDRALRPDEFYIYDKTDKRE